MSSLALRINVDSTIQEIEVDNIINTLQTRTAYPFEEYKLLERYEIFNNCWLYIYGMLNMSHPINNFEFQYFTMTGDVFAVLVNTDGNFLDLSESQFRVFYQEEIDLDSDIVEDELTSEDDEFDSLDGFIVNDIDSDGDISM